jgi:acetyltransferase-like isoleucine patch superfamily enzyme
MKKRILIIKIYNFLFYILLMQFIMGISNVLPNLKTSNQIRGFLLKPFFKKCGVNFQIAKGAIINLPRNIEIGNNVYIAHDVWINGSGGLIIGDGVIISPKVVIATTKHAYVNGAVSNKLSDSAPITIGKGSWIASNSTITMNVNIGKGCIIGANSSVTKDIPEYSFAGGVPAKVIKTLNN